MNHLMLVFGWIVAIIIGLIGLVVVWYMFTGKIDLSKLISGPNNGASLSRFQFLIFTFVVAVGLFLIIVGQDPPAFPSDIPEGIFILLGISAASYLTSKGVQLNYDLRRNPPTPKPEEKE